MPPSPAGGRKGRLRIRRTWELDFGAAAGASGTPPPTMRCCEFAWPFHSSKAPSPIPSPSGGGCRPQGRQERENAAEPRRGKDRSGGGCATVLPLANGHVLPLPSSASRGIGGCHLPPLGEGKGGCEFAERGSLTLALLRERRDAAPYNEMLRIRPAFPFIQDALSHSLPQRGRVPPTRAAGEGERSGTATRKRPQRRRVCNGFTARKRSGSPSSVIRLAGDRRMPPSPAGHRR